MPDNQLPSSYDFVPIVDRQPLRFPNGARIAVLLTLNIEYWEAERSGQKEPLFTGGPMTIPHPLPGDVWDSANWTWREYGQRVGVWRVFDLCDRLGIALSCTVNGLTLTERPRIVDAVRERGWELVPHNWAQNDILTYYAHRPEAEREIITRTLDTFERVVGRPARAWLSSALRSSRHTPAFLVERGVIAFSDYLNDDQPYLIRTVNGPIVCVPYSNDVNDFNMFARGGMTPAFGVETLKACFDQLYAEGEQGGRIMNFGLHPHVIGQPYRIGALRDFLEYAKAKQHVWFASREEIAAWYLENHASHIAVK
ncbi:MAG: polysaccharide deacetylase [Betaproteobacteria bacterium]|nr:polysaccharide deacetylase [Betaproteobacteria bacterium]